MLRRFDTLYLDKSLRNRSLTSPIVTSYENVTLDHLEGYTLCPHPDFFTLVAGRFDSSLFLCEREPAEKL